MAAATGAMGKRRRDDDDGGSGPSGSGNGTEAPTIGQQTAHIKNKMVRRARSHGSCTVGSTAMQCGPRWRKGQLTGCGGSMQARAACSHCCSPGPTQPEHHLPPLSAWVPWHRRCGAPSMPSSSTRRTRRRRRSGQNAPLRWRGQRSLDWSRRPSRCPRQAPRRDHAVQSAFAAGPAAVGCWQ